jgi:hypothetical protein
LKCISNTNDKQQKVTAFFPIRRSSRKTKNIVNEEKQLALEKAIASQNEDGLKVINFNLNLYILFIFLYFNFFYRLPCFLIKDVA